MWELTKQLSRNMRFFWPRAASRVYDEARRLEARGWARAEREFVGKRRRTTYSITARGRRELESWLATPPRATILECEPLLRIMLGDLGKPSSLAQALAQARADAKAILEVGRVVAAEYRRGDAPFQDDVHVRAFVFDFLSHHALMLLGWADRTERAIRGWKSLARGERVSRAIAAITACLAKYPEK
jgi:DNA-binding PadR family transcriptional regulator